VKGGNYAQAFVDHSAGQSGVGPERLSGHAPGETVQPQLGRTNTAYQAVQAREPQDDADGAQRQTPGNPHQPLYPYVGAGGERQIGSSSDSPLGFHGSVGWGNKQMPPLPDDAERPK